MEFLIDKEDRNKSGIYMITNMVTGKFYIGSTKSFRQRFMDHRKNLRRRIHDSIYLQNSWDKYGEKKFIFSKLELVEKERKSLLKSEQYYLDSFTPWHPEIGYNTQKVAGSPLGIKHTPEQIEANRQRNLGRKLTLTQRESFFEAWESRKKSFKLLSPEGVIFEGNGIGKFAEKMGLNERCLCNVVKGIASNHRGWTNPDKRIQKIKIIKKEIIKLLSPEGEYHEILPKDRQNFGKKHGISDSSLYSLWNGKLRHAKGWVRFDKKEYLVEIYHEKYGWLKFCKFRIKPIAEKLGLNRAILSKLSRMGIANYPVK